MAIAKLTKIETAVDMELHDPNDAKKKLGVVFHVRGIDNPEATRFMKLATGRVAMKSHKKDGKVREDEIADLIVSQAFDPSPETLATCITGWDWGKEEIEEGEGPPDFTPENVLRVLQMDWVRDQVFTAATSAKNFTKA